MVFRRSAIVGTTSLASRFQLTLAFRRNAHQGPPITSAPAGGVSSSWSLLDDAPKKTVATVKAPAAASVAPPPPPPPKTSHTVRHSNTALPSTRGFRTPPEILDVLIPYVPSFWVGLPMVMELLPQDLRDMTLAGGVNPQQFFRKYRFYFDQRTSFGRTEIRLRPDVNHNKRGMADAKYTTGMSSNDIHQQTMMRSSNSGGSSVVAGGDGVGGVGSRSGKHETTSFPDGVGTSGGAGQAPAHANLIHRNAPRNSEENLVLSLIAKCKQEWQPLAEFLPAVSNIVMKHPSYDGKLGITGLLEKYPQYFQVVDGKIRVRTFFIAPYALDDKDASTSPHAEILSKVLPLVPPAPSEAPPSAADAFQNEQISVDTSRLLAVLSESERSAIKTAFKNFPRFLRMHGRLLVVSTDNVRVRRFVPEHEQCADHLVQRRLESDSVNPADPVLRIPATMEAVKEADWAVKELYDALPLMQAVVLEDLLALVPSGVRQALPSTTEELLPLLGRFPDYFSSWAYPDDPSILVIQRAKLRTDEIGEEDLVRAVLNAIPQGGIDAEKLMRRVPLPIQRYLYKHGLKVVATTRLAGYVLVVGNRVLRTQ